MPGLKHVLFTALIVVATVFVVRKAGIASTVGLDA